MVDPAPSSANSPRWPQLIWLVSFAMGLALVDRYAAAIAQVTVSRSNGAMQPATAGGFVFAGLAVVTHCLGQRRLVNLFGALAAGLTSVVLADEVLARPSALLDMLFMRGQGGGLVMAPVTILAVGVIVSLALVFFTPGVRGLWRQATEGTLAALLLACGVIGLFPGEGPAGALGMDPRSALTFAGLGVAFFVMVGKLRGGSLNRPIPRWMPWVAGAGVGMLVIGLWVGLTTDEERMMRESKSHVRVNVVDRTRWALNQHGKDLKRLGDLLVNAGSSHGLLDVYLSHLPAIRSAWMLDGNGEVQFQVGDEASRFPGELASISKVIERCRSDGVMTVSPVQREEGQPDRVYACVPLHGDDCLLVEQDLDKLVLAALPNEGPKVLNVQVSKGSETLFRSGPPVRVASDPAPMDEFEGQVSYGDQLWNLAGTVRGSSAAGDRAASNTLVLWIGLFLAVSTAFAVRKSELGRQRAVSLEQANATIEEQFVSLNDANERLEEKALHLTAVQQRLSRAAQEKRRVLDSLSAFLIGVDSDGFVVEWNQVSCEVFGLGADEAVGRIFTELDIPWDKGAVNDAISEARAGSRRVLRDLFTVAKKDEDETSEPLLVSFTVNPTQERGRRGFAIIGADVTERQMLQVQLHASRKLESVGTLAAGIAHEINTPMQFVGDNVRFVAESIGTVTELMSLVPQVLADPGRDSLDGKLLAKVEKSLDGVDVDFISEEIPQALAETLEGIERVTSIVRAMKDFSHPGGDGVQLSDLNHAIETTLQVARNEYKYHADVVTDLGELPRVECWLDDLNQVFLNLIVNGAHAIHDRLGDSGERGTLTVRSRMDGDIVELRFGDTGCGVPEDARGKIYDQFFTTKEIGRGTGLGLAIARSVVVDKHGGTLDFETEMGVGTTFVIRLPALQQHSIEEQTAEADPVC